MTFGSTKKNVFLLATCQALFMTCTSGVIATSALVGLSLATNKGWATAPLSMQFAAGMLATIPASFYMKRFGRRIGFLTGTALGIAGVITSTYGILLSSLPLFCLGSILFGFFAGFSRYFRFAAAEAADERFRSKAISLVLAGGVVAAVTGPTLARATVDLFSPILFAGTYASLAVVQICIVGVLLFIDLPKPDAEERSGQARPLVEIIRQPVFIVALLGATISYAVMAFLMSITPVAMREHHFDFTDSTFVIQGHILGMYLPAFFTGHLIARFGVLEIMLVGACLLVVCVGINLSGTEFINFVMALTLVGVGWNFLFVGATTLLTQSCTPAEKAKTQGFNEFIVLGVIAAGTLTSGAVQHSFGWSGVNMAVIPLIVLVFGVTLWLWRLQRPALA
ncbi:MAG: MFS transporter [Rhodospirillaceae bacterium]|jgi:MFS family permease|nr:MFS transporter [Rhodospirillaceae bacterium]MBT5459249.1 MFS transporter [Rhodospirillaceae bacterium]